MFLVVPLLVGVAYLTLAERRIIGAMQLRKGPNIAGPMGLLQPIADAVKLLNKEQILPAAADKFLFFLAPVLVFTLAVVGWAVIPIGEQYVISDINVGVLYFLAISSMGVYGIIIAGWASNSKYAFFGAIRASAQMVSYELSMSFCVLSVAISAGSLNMREIVLAQHPWYLDILMFPMLIIFFISILAETKRHPFDMPEAESELVAGYHVEYSSMGFALFFLGEYANMILTSAGAVILFMGGWLPPFNMSSLSFIPGIAWFILKVMFLLFIFIWVRAALPRYRYDQLMRLGWKVLLPFTMFWMMLISTVVVFVSQLNAFTLR